jgi:hypothetical protein
MHMMEFLGGWIVNHNGDFSGDVELRSPWNPTQVTVVPFGILRAVVAEKVRRDRIAALEQASDEDLIK